MVLTLAGNAVGGILQLGLLALEVATGEIAIELLIMYLKFCFFSSVFLSLFMFGGIITPLIGILYTYYILYQKMKCWSKNIPDDKCKLF